MCDYAYIINFRIIIIIIIIYKLIVSACVILIVWALFISYLLIS